MITVLSRPGFECRGVGSRLRLRQAKGTDFLTLCQRDKECLLLHVRSLFQQGCATRRVIHAHHRRNRAIPTGDFHQGKRIGDKVRLRAAMGFRHGHPHQAEASHFGENTHRNGALAFPFNRMGGQTPGGEIPCHIADHCLFFR